MQRRTIQLLILLLTVAPLKGQDAPKVKATPATVARESSEALKLQDIATTAAQNKPDFSGTWKLNPEKSKLKPDNGPSKLLNVVVKIDHKDSNFSESMIVSRSDGDQTAEGKYTIDGEDSHVQLPFGVAKAATKWEGAALVIEWKNEKEMFQIRRVFTLSADGKTLTLRGRDLHDPSQKDDDEIMLFEKQ